MASAAKRQAGLTLVELLVALAILAVLAALAVPGFGAAITRNKLAAAANSFAALEALARSEAIKRGGRVALCAGAGACGADWSAGWTVFVDQNLNCAMDAGEETLRQIRPAAGLAVTASAGCVGFGPMGENTNGVAVEFGLCGGGQGLRLRIAPVGRLGREKAPC